MAAWDNYARAAELTGKDESAQAAILCGVMSMECVKVMNSLVTLSNEDKQVPSS